MKIGIYDPYLDTLGGGERYSLTIAEGLSDRNEINIFWNNPDIKDKANKFLNLDLHNVKFVPNIFDGNTSLIKKSFKLLGYDILFFVSDGSIPFSLAKKNYIHFQVPFKNKETKNLQNKIKLLYVKKVICNSSFTLGHILSTYPLPKERAVVVYPPVDTEKFNKTKKENIILNVGRFSGGLHPKKQDILITVFKDLCNGGLTGWELILAGGASVKDNKFLDKLKEEAQNFPIKIIPNVSFKDLQNLYGKAKIYWHATGFGEDLGSFPEKAEHFGITTIEAMAAECVPIVINAGGQPEIVKEGENGFLWSTLKELTDKTLSLIENEEQMGTLGIRAKTKAREFSKGVFLEKINELFIKS
jgi:glycosyltransferase involved in cell wall biosynthesis